MWLAMAEQGVTLFAFLCITFLWDYAERFGSKHNFKVGHFKWLFLLAHPVMRDGLKEFCIHIVVYSGYVLSR